MGARVTEAAAASPAARAYAEAPPPDRSAAWRELSYAVLDFETTGLRPAGDEIVSFATVPIDGGSVRVGGSRYRLVRPRRMPGAESIRIHGLRPADLEDAPPFEDVLDELLEALAGRVIVAHVAAVERGFLVAALSRHGLELRNPIVDTAALARELGRPTGLSDVARSFRLPVHRPHHADGDALTTAQVFLALASHLDGAGPLTLGAMEGLRSESPKLSLRERVRRLRRDLIRSSARP